MADTSPLEAKAALVTGASKGIGKAIAVALARRGARVWLVGRDRGDLEEAGRQVHAAGGQGVLCAGDLTDDDALEGFAGQIRRETPALDILVHSAGLFRMGHLDNLPVSELDALYRVNVRAPYLLTQKLLPLLRKAAGQVVFVNSSAGLQAGPQWGAYSATKAALKMLADSLRAEVDALGIRVISVYPGRTATPMQAEVHELEGRPYVPEQLMQPEDVAESVAHAITLPRTAEVTDLALRPMRAAT